MITDPCMLHLPFKPAMSLWSHDRDSCLVLLFILSTLLWVDWPIGARSYVPSDLCCLFCSLNTSTFAVHQGFGLVYWSQLGTIAVWINYSNYLVTKPKMATIRVAIHYELLVVHSHLHFFEITLLDMWPFLLHITPLKQEDHQPCFQRAVFAMCTPSSSLNLFKPMNTASSR